MARTRRLSALEEGKLERIEGDRRKLNTAKQLIFDLQDSSHAMDSEEYRHRLANARSWLEQADNALLYCRYRLTDEVDERTES